MYKIILFTALSATLFLFSCSNPKENSHENTKIDIENSNKENPYENAKIDIEVFNNDTVNHDPKYTGYGYNILIHGAVQIHQPHKPGVPGLKGFTSADDAKKAGGLIVQKIQKNIMPPTVTPEELDSLGILK